MKKTFADDYRIITAYQNKALDWPEVKAGDSTSLDIFFIFSKYLTKLEDRN